MEEKKMDLASFLNLSNPEQFDFVEDILCENQKTKYLESDTYQKFFLYRVDTKHMNDTLSYAEDLVSSFANQFIEFVEKSKELLLKDPDNSSEMLQEIYKILWPIITKKQFMKNSDFWIASDTMTSVQYSLKAATSIYKYRMNEDFTKIYIRGKTPWNNREPGISTNVGIELAANDITTHFCELLKKDYPHLEGFISSYHTIGNYCPVPSGFNVPRSNGGKYDYWDLTLMKIYEWYCTYDDKIDEDKRDNLIQYGLLHGRGAALNCKKWLESFGRGKIGWYNFVNTLFMQDYVYTDDDEEVKSNQKSYYEPKPFWEGHNWENIALPIDKCDEFFETVTDRILNRGKRMVETLKELLKGV